MVTYRILIVDDQRRTRQSIRALLATGFQKLEIQEAANGIEALRCVEQFQPQIVLMDARMPEMDGMEATRRIKTLSPQILVIVMSMYTEYQEEAFSAGADAFVSKGEPPEQLLEAIDATVSRKWLD